MPDQPLPRVRTANKAIIRDEHGRLLLSAMHSPSTGADWWMPPGGGQDWGEDRIHGLQRECREELGCEVIVDGLACLRTYIGKNHRYAAHDPWFHQEEAFWFCHLAEGAEPRVGEVPDTFQVGVAWKTLSELRDVIPEGHGGDSGAPVFSPLPLLDWLEADPDTRPLYLGDCI